MPGPKAMKYHNKKKEEKKLPHGLSIHAFSSQINGGNKNKERNKEIDIVGLNGSLTIETK